MNKKFLISITLAILIGSILGNIAYKKYQIDKELDIEYNSYLLQLGVFKSKEELQDNIKNIDNYMIVEKNNMFYVYLGVSTKKGNAQKVKNVFKEYDVDVSIKKSVIDNVEFISNLEQYDILLDSATSSEDIMSINEVILSSYEEIVLSK